MSGGDVRTVADQGMRDIGMVQRWIATSVAREALVWESLADGQIGRRGFRGSAIGRMPL